MGFRADTNEVQGATVLLMSTARNVMTKNNLMFDDGQMSW